MKYAANHLTPFPATLLCIRRRMRILSEQREPKDLDQLSAHTSIACALLNSLLALFSAPVLYFQWLAHSSAKTPGVWGIPDGSTGYSGCVSLCDTSAFSAPQRYHLQWFGSLLCFHNLTNPSFPRIDKYAPPFHKVTNPSSCKLFLFTSIQNPGVSPYSDSKALSVPSVPLWQNLLGPSRAIVSHST